MEKVISTLDPTTPKQKKSSIPEGLEKDPAEHDAQTDNAEAPARREPIGHKIFIPSRETSTPQHTHTVQTDTRQDTCTH
jgi:hypothetical protein